MLVRYTTLSASSSGHPGHTIARGETTGYSQGHRACSRTSGARSTAGSTLAMTETSKLNYFPVKGGVSKHYSPRMILMGEHLNYEKHFQVPFGAYVQACNEPSPTNSQLPRTLDAIYLRPLNNIQGGHEVMDLNTGKVITRRKVTEIPITRLVIKAVEAMAKREGFKSLKFKNRNNVVFHDTGLIAGVEDNTNNNENEHDENEFDDEEDEDYIDEEEDDIEDESQEYDEVDRNEVEELIEDNTNPAHDLENRDDEDDNEDEDIQNTGVVSEETEESDDDEETTESETRRSTRESRPVDRLVSKHARTDLPTKDSEVCR